MNITTIVDVKDMLKIKDISGLDEYTQIKANVAKLEIIESSDESAGVDMNSLKQSIKAREMDEEGSVVSEQLKSKSGQVKSSQIDPAKKDLIKDNEF